MRLKTVIGLLLGAALLVGACAATDEAAPGSTTSASAAAPETTAAAGAETSTDNLAFTGVTLDGASFDGRQLAGKPTVLWFWAPWCPTCWAQSRDVKAITAEYAGQVNVVGVGGLADTDEIREFARDVPSAPIQLIDEAGEIWRHFGVTSQSRYVFLDEDGSLFGHGYLDDEGLADQVAQLVG